MIRLADRSLPADLFESAAVFAFLLVDRVGELVELSVECGIATQGDDG
jgi:hypothetical protein